MNYKSIFKITKDWNNNELDSLKVYIDINNGSLVCRFKSPVINGCDKICVDLFDSKKLEYLHEIYECIHVLDCLECHDLSLWCLKNSLSNFMEDFLAKQMMRQI